MGTAGRAVRILLGAEPIGGEAENPVMATGEGGKAPGTAGPLQGAEFLGVVELETELGFEGTLTG